MAEEENITATKVSDEDKMDERDELDELAKLLELLKNGQMGVLDYFAELLLRTDSELYQRVEQFAEENQQQLKKAATEGGRKKGGTTEAYLRKLINRNYMRYLEKIRGQR